MSHLLPSPLSGAGQPATPPGGAHGVAPHCLNGPRLNGNAAIGSNPLRLRLNGNAAIGINPLAASAATSGDITFDKDSDDEAEA